MLTEFELKILQDIVNEKLIDNVTQQQDLDIIRCKLEILILQKQKYKKGNENGET